MFLTGRTAARQGSPSSPGWENRALWDVGRDEPSLEEEFCLLCLHLLQSGFGKHWSFAREGRANGMLEMKWSGRTLI